MEAMCFSDSAEYCNYTSTSDVEYALLSYPVSLTKALKSSDAPKWQTAINSEYNSLISNETFSIIRRSDVPDKEKLIPIRVILTLKDEHDGMRYKARAV